MFPLNAIARIVGVVLVAEPLSAFQGARLYASPRSLILLKAQLLESKADVTLKALLPFSGSLDILDILAGRYPLFPLWPQRIH